MNLKTLALTGFLATLEIGALAQTGTPFVQQETITVTGITTDAQTYTLPTTQKQTVRTYLDGLSRPIQTIGIQASPLGNDIIEPIAYDNLGRQTTGYLPYGGASTDVMGSYRSNAITTAQPAFYNNTAQSLVPVDANPYSQQVFENSPLQRPLESGMDGTGFQPVSGQHYKTVSYRPNNSSTDGNILQWSLTGTNNGSTYYGANSLWVTDATDEDGIETRLFKDLNGHTVLKRQILSSGNLDTYYIYNAAGLLSYVVPPLAVTDLAANSYSLTTAPLSNLVFYYVYDTMGRMTSKKVPGGVTISIIYDPFNRPVLIQDANLAANYQWNYIKYDVKGRVIEQGIYTDPNHYTAAVMQSTVSGLTYTTWYESRTSSLTLNGYYSDSVFPTTTSGTLQPLAYQYYDNYVLNSTTTYSYHTTGLTVGATTAAVKGMPTILQQSTVSNTITAVWLTKVQFYDQNLHPIQVASNNLLYSSTAPTDYATNVPDFCGMPLVTLVSKQTASGTTNSVQTNITYDQAYRVTNISQVYNGGATIQVAAYTYNEVGQLVKKGLGGLNSGTFPAAPVLNTAISTTTTEVATQSITMNPATGGGTGFTVPSGTNFTGYISTGYLQVVDYRYNIRGQLLSINNSKLADDYGKTSDDPAAVFGMTFLYDGTDATLNNGSGNSPKYDGRLSAVKWMSKDGVGYERSYVFSYDGVNRYTGETYSERTAGSLGNFSNNVHGFDETGITYDAGGNIQTLQRNSSTEGTNTNVQIDNLTYAYTSTNPNQLSTVTDGTGSNYTNDGFRNLTGSTTAYQYDNNGNLTNDYYKGITASFNVANRTDKVTVTAGTSQYINYVYDASGKLIRKLAYSGGTLQTQTDYLDGFVYLNGTLSFFNMPEGRVINNSGTFTQEFIITDDQGNARVSFQNNGSGVAVVEQENSYYGFGLQLPHSPVGMSTPQNRFMYNGGNSEWQNDYSNLPDYYQTFNRNYDHAIGRFVSMDPQPESAESMTGYQYAGNNPIMMNDPDGANAAAPGAWKTIENCLAIEEGFSGNMDLGGGGGGGNGGDDGSATTSNGDYTDFWNTVLGAAEDILQSLNSTTDNPSGIQSITFTNSDALLALGDTEGDFNLSFASNGGVVLSPIGGDDSSPSTGTPSMVTTNDGPNNFNDPGGDANQDNRSFLVFESDCVNGKNRVDGRLVWYNQNTDGSVTQAGSYSARSGSKTKNPIPTGDYQLSDYRDRTKDGMVVDGIGFSIDISPDPYLDRSKLRIHPDGGLPGTDGCIGLTGDDNELLDFQQKIQTYLSNHGTMELIVPLQKSLASP